MYQLLKNANFNHSAPNLMHLNSFVLPMGQLLAASKTVGKIHTVYGFSQSK